MHGNSDWHMGSGWMGSMGLWWLLICVPLMIAVVWFALSATRRRGGAQE